MPALPINGFNFHFQDHGTGPAIVLLHGFPLDGRVWNAVTEPLGWKCRVIVPDLRGFGQSRSEEPFTMTSLADDVHALLKELKVEGFILGGLSMGGYVALAYARRYPRKISGLMLINSKAEADNSDQKKARDSAIELVKKSGTAAVAEQMLPKMMCDTTRQRHPDKVAALKDIMESQSPRAVENALAAMRDREDQRNLVHSLAEPVLIVAGVDDGIVPLSSSEALHRETPHSELCILADAGHMTPLEQPAKLAEAISDFAGKIF